MLHRAYTNEGQQTGHLGRGRDSVFSAVCRGDPTSDLTRLLDAETLILGPGLLMQSHHLPKTEPLALFPCRALYLRCGTDFSQTWLESVSQKVSCCCSGTGTPRARRNFGIMSSNLFISQTEKLRSRGDDKPVTDLALKRTYLNLWSGWWWSMWLRAALLASHRCGFNSWLGYCIH